MYCVGLQLVRQCGPQWIFPLVRGAESFFLFGFKQKSCFITDPFLYRAKNLEILGLLALFFCLNFTDNIIEEHL